MLWTPIQFKRRGDNAAFLHNQVVAMENDGEMCVSSFSTAESSEPSSEFNQDVDEELYIICKQIEECVAIADNARGISTMSLCI